MSTTDSNFLPSQTGLDLGSASQQWDAYLQNLIISGAISGAAIGNIRIVDGLSYTTIDAALSSLSGGMGVVLVPSNYAGATETTVAEGQVIIDLREGSFQVRGRPVETGTPTEGLLTIEGKQPNSGTNYRVFAVRAALDSTTIKDLFAVENNRTNPSDINFRNTSINVGDTDSSVSAAGTVMLFFSPTGDTSNPIQVFKAGDGTGGTASFLVTRTGQIQSRCGGLASIAFLVKVAADTTNKFQIQETGQVDWGVGGSTAVDVSISRAAANVLQLASGDSFRPADAIGQSLGDSTHQWRVFHDVIATGSLPAAGASMDGVALIEDAGAGDRNLILYAGGQRFRIDGGAAF